MPFSALVALCAENAPVTGEFPLQWSVTQNFDVSFDLVIWDAIVLITGEPWGAFPECLGEQIPKDNASTLHNDSLRQLVYNMTRYLTGAPMLKTESCHMQTLAPVAAQEVVVLTTHGAASDDKAGSMTLPGHWMKGNYKFHINYTPITLCRP